MKNLFLCSFASPDLNISVRRFINQSKKVEIYKKIKVFGWHDLKFEKKQQIVGGLLDYLFGYSETGAFEWVAYIIILLPSLAVGARRLHDTGRSGWWQLLYLTIIGIIILIVWWVADGDKKNNKFGQPIKIKKS